MKRNPSRLVPLAVIAVLALGACGSGDDDSATGTPPPTVTDSSDDGLIAPRPIELSSGGNLAGSATAAAESDSADRSMATDMIAPYQITHFVAGDGLPALPTNDTGWVFQAGTEVTAEQVTQLATALGVTGEPQRHDENGYVYWTVGPTDGTAPSVTVSADAQQSWYYNSAWANQATVGSTGCAIAEPMPAIDVPEGSADAVAPVETKPVEPPVCTIETTPPPPGVPTADEAEARTRELMTAVGLDPAGFELEPYADEWSANVNATEQLDGHFSGRSFSAGFGAEGALQYASGQLAQPAPVGPYPLVDLDTAIARLNDQTGFYMGGFGGGGIALDTAVASREVAPAGVDVVEPDVALAPPVTETPASGGGSDGSVGTATAPPVSEPVPVEIPTPQEVTVTLVDVQPDVWWVSDVDGTMWLLPAYRFIGDDGGWYTVPAVTDEFLVRVPVDTVPVEPVPGDTAPATLPPVTAPPASTPTETVPPFTVAPEGTPDGLVALIGLSLDEFTASAEDLGYSVRVVYNDETGSFAVTDDYSETRVNVHTRSEGGVEVVYLIANLG